MTRNTVAYLCSEYPAISHTFIYREIESLRKAGMTVYTASIHKPEKLDLMTTAEQEEAANTLMVLSQPATAIIAAHLHCLARNPGGYLKMAADAFRLLFKGPKNFVKAAAYFAEAGILLRWAHRHGITHIHEHFGNPTAIVAMLMKRYGGITFSISVHGPDIFYTVDSAMLPEKVREASFVRCISHYCRSQIMRISDVERWDRFHIVRCGIDPELYTPRPEPANAVPELLCVGRLTPAKGQHILIEACAMLDKANVPFHLTFVGDGPDRESLQNYTRTIGLDRKVTFTGALGQDKVRGHYDRADIFVLASFAEGVPVVLMEAMAKEIPVISTRITGIPELIEHGEDGLLAVPGDPEDLARQIRILLENGELRARYGQAGRRKVSAMYNQHQNNNLLVEHFKNELNDV
ncbi:colanic acid biosynthesis glycosyltransferase WcaL [Chlorobaculum limnaeum]|uniref:Colanic acid biosynthesis glycosyltransferase WcaL n=1 Tax=Chlorobaculum limnaeum TaxID=274537 RepID=A0A1D8CZ64_CHLLM|nr:glycosyltransferase family 4 protein [Chlorobaculum limnaeum]AOS84190.1 colanic acid biosynthesis glycosyltransferase WcaL [Chlorobaculum limnaeum]